MSLLVRPLTPKSCPACGAVNRFTRIKGQLTCQDCGYTPASTAPASPFTAPITEVDEDLPAIQIDVTNTTPFDTPGSKQTSEFKRIKPKFKTTTTERPAVSAQSVPTPQKDTSATQTSEIKRLTKLQTATSERPVTSQPHRATPLPTPPGQGIAPLPTPPAPQTPTARTTVQKLAVKPKVTAVGGYSPERLERLQNTLVTEVLLHPEPVSSWVQAIYATGLQHLRQQQWAEAAKAFKRAVDEERDFVDAHLWLARLSQNEKEEREHLSAVLAILPSQMEAMTAIMVLNGQMSEAEAVRALNPHNAPASEEATGPVGTDAKLMKCPNCNGRMKAGDDGQSVVCEFCGHTEARTKAQDYGFKSLTMALLKQRGQEIQWVVGERLLKCQTCGAERTLQHGAFSEHCLFCGSSYVVQTDALGSFQQPDGMVKFIVKKQKALELVQQALSSGLERVKGWFGANEAGRIEIETLFVPFWLFDFTLDVKRTFTRKVTYNQSMLERARHMALPPVRYENFSEMAHDVPVAASKEVNKKLIERAGRFMLDRVHPYHPDLLASHSALIYSLPFDKAALDARQRVTERMRTLYEESTSDEDVRVSLFFQQAQFRLVLMPFWMVTIMEQDGDLRPALVNGQTGAVALGKAHRPKA